MAVTQHPAYPEESMKLAETLNIVEEERALAESELVSAEEELKQARAFDPDKLPIREILYTKAVQTVRNMTLARQKPYFTRIDFSETGAEKQSYYIGKYGVLKPGTTESAVIDWRAPLANLYYSGQLGHVEYQAPDGRVEGELSLKRQFDISGGVLRSIFDTDIVSQDAYLQNALNAMNGERLKEIVTTIQAEQNYVIRHPLKRSLAVQGVAGSGKTTIALHRIAYLLYAFGDQLRPQNMLILAPNPLFLNYIAGVLPDLGVEQVNQTTFPRLISEWLGGRLGKIDFSDRTEHILSLPPDELEHYTAISRFKGSLEFSALLDEFLDDYFRHFAPEDGFRFGPVPLWSKAELDQFLLVDEAPFPIERRVLEFKKQLTKRAKAASERLNAWYMDESDRRAEILRKQISDPNECKARLSRLYESRDDRIRQTSAQVSPFVREALNAFPSTEPLSLYRAFWENLRNHAVSFAAREAAERTLSRMDAKMPLESEDAAPIAWIAMRMCELKRFEIRHVVIDEAQDFSPLEFKLLSRMMPAATFTVVGDLMQGIHGWRGLQKWDDLTEGVFGNLCAAHSLDTSYRSTVEIMDVAFSVSNLRPVPGQSKPKAVIRHGEKPEFQSCSDSNDQIQKITETVRRWQKDGMRVIAVIVRFEKDARALAKRLPEDLKARVLNTEDAEYAGNVYVAPASAVKGLEFDGVILADADEKNYPDTDLNARLLYVALTRPLHRLCVLDNGRQTPLLKAAAN